jgi:hypothetical protein
MSALCKAVVLAAALVASGCVEEALQQPVVARQCRTDADCGLAGLQCYDQRVCITRQDAATQVALRLNPPKMSGKLVEHFDLQVTTAKQTEQVTLVLTEPAIVRGTVRRDKQGWPDSVSGTLVATASGGKAGADLTYQATSYATRKMFVGSSLLHGFELRLQPGLTYDLAFHPEASDQIPPYYTTLTVGGSIEAWDQLVLPAADTLVHVRGTLRAGDEALAGLRVYLQDEAGKPCSTRALSDAEGKFDVLVAADAMPQRLRWEPPAAMAGMPYGTLEGPFDIRKAQRKNSDVALGVLDVGPLGLPSEATIAVVGADGAAEDGALVRIQQELKPKQAAGGKLGVLSAYLDVHGYTDAQGVFRAPSRLGKLRLWVSPHAKSPSASWHGKLSLESPGRRGALQVQCLPRRALRGTVLDYAGRPVGNASLVLRRVGKDLGQSPDGTDAASHHEPTTVTTADGQFEMAADPGTWWVWVMPAAGSLLPAVLAAQVTVALETAPAPLQVQIPAPLLVRGRVVTAGGMVLGGVAVDVLAHHDPMPRQMGGEVGAMAMPSSVWDHHLLATAVSGEDGTFEVLVAP